MNTKVLLSILLITIILIISPFLSGVSFSSTPEKTTRLTFEERNWLDNNSDKLILYYNSFLPPIEFYSKNTGFSGFGAGLINVIEKRLKINFIKRSVHEPNQLDKKIKNGDAAIAPALIRTRERERFIFFTKPYLNIPGVLIVNKNERTDTKGKSYKRKIAVVSKLAFSKQLIQSLGNKYNIIPVSSSLEGLIQVSLSQVDGCIENLAASSYYIKKASIPNLKIAEKVDFSLDLNIGVSRKYPLLHSSVQKALNDISPAEIENLKDQWLSFDVSGWLNPDAVRIIKISGLTIFIFILLLIGISLFLKQRLKRESSELERTSSDLKEQGQILQMAFEATDTQAWEFYPKEGFGRLGPDFNKKTTRTYNDWSTTIHPDDLQKADKALNDYIKSGGNDEIETELRILKDGKYHWTLSRGRTVERDQDGRPVRIIGLITNLEKIKNIQTELENSLERFKALFDLLPYSCSVQDMNRRYLMVNKSFCNALNLSQKEMTGHTREELGIIFDPEQVRLINGEMENKGIVNELEILYKIKGKEPFYYLFSSCYIDWKDEKAILSMGVDITARKEVEKALKESEKLYSLALDAANDGIWDIKFQPEELFCSTNYYRMLGYEKGDFEDKISSWENLLHPDDKENAIAKFNSYLNGHTEVYESEFRLRTKNGDYKSILSRGKIVKTDDNGNPARMVGTHIDITEKKLSRRILKESEENLRVTLNSIGDAVIATDIDGNITRINPVAEELTGWSAEEALKEHLDKILNIIDSSTRLKVDSPVKKVIDSGTTVGLSNHTILVSKNGKEYHIADAGSPIRNDKKEIIGVVIVFRDVTEEYELQNMLRQAQKMEAIGVLAGGIAHDFNNILSALMGFLDLAKLKNRDEQPVKRYLDSVSTAALRARDLVRHILTFSRKSDSEKNVIKIDTILKETLKFIRASLPSNIEIKREIKVQPALVLADPTQIHQILMNLFTNAGYSMREKGGTMEVTLERTDLFDPEAHSLNNLKPGSYLKLTISDTGCGISKSIIDKIFDPFFTTKGREEGTGMGLSTVFGILKDMHGAISVESKVGKGSTFAVFIPEQKENKNKTDFLETALLKGTGNILFVDDEELIVKGTTEILTTLGYSPTGLTDGLKALKMVEKDPNFFNLIITDMTMPEINGIELSKKIKLINPNLPVILCTGFGEGLTKDICESAGVSELVMKPAIAGELSLSVHNALNSVKVKKND